MRIIGIHRTAFSIGLVLAIAAIVNIASGQTSGGKAAASSEKPIEKEITNSVGMKLELIPAGEFMMGSGEPADTIVKAFPDYQVHDQELTADFFADEFPQHKVRITKPFYFSKYETTNGQFKKFVEETGYKTQAETADTDRHGTGGWGFNQEEQKFEGRDPKYNWRTPGFPVPDDRPVVDVTWNDANAFMQWLSKKDGKKYRLPTEAEWEYAARAGTKTRYWSGDDPKSLAKIANVADADFYGKFPKYYPKELTLPVSDGNVFPAPVGSYAANAFGLCDVHGNVWEWTNDWYGKDYYANSPVNDPQGPATGGEKVRRGGAWHTAPLWSRISFRNYNTVVSRYPNLGFRIVQEVGSAAPSKSDR